MAVIDEYVSRYPEQFVKVEGEKRGGARNNFFYLTSLVDAPYIMCCDQDDVWLPDKIAVTLERMKKLEDECGARKVPLLVFTELRVVDDRLKSISDTMSSYQQLECSRTELKDIVVQNYITGCAMMINRYLLHMVYGRNKKRKIKLENVIMHDWWCALIAAAYGRISFIKHPTILYRQHGSNSVGAKNVNTLRYAARKVAKFREIKESLELTRIQAGEFQKCFLLDSDNMVSQYAHIRQRNKISRLIFYRKHRMSKSGSARNVGFWLFG